MATAFESFDSADVILLFPPFRATLFIAGNAYFREDAIREWARKHADRKSTPSRGGQHEGVSQVDGGTFDSQHVTTVHET